MEVARRAALLQKLPHNAFEHWADFVGRRLNPLIARGAFNETEIRRMLQHKISQRV